MDEIKLYATLKDEPSYVIKEAVESLKEISLKTLTNAFRDLKKDVYGGCYRWYLFRDTNFDYALVMGNQLVDNHYEICMKLAHQPHNAMMQYDFDYDWEVPECNDAGDLYDTETCIYEESDLEIAFKDMVLMLKGFFEAERRYNKEI